ncbi:MAG: L-histidine N(alpha)-methyltransferase [Bacteroidota bacterium]
MDEFKHTFLAQLLKDVDEGLSAPHKYLKSKYFYDARGDLLFRRITHLPEYYLTLCETEILHDRGKIIMETFDPASRINIIELGSGDGTKTKLLLGAGALLKQKMAYYPVDISPDTLILAKNNIGALVPVIPVAADYSDILEKEVFKKLPNKLILFLGSNIGNFSEAETGQFMRYLVDNLERGEHVLIGFDLVKDAAVISAAYNDATGMTSDFNLNLLSVLNNELGADFDPDNFFHAPVYDQSTQAAKSYLVSSRTHSVFFEKLGKSFTFEKGESIFTEISRKYTLEGIAQIAKDAGFRIVSTHTDHRDYFADVLMRKI